MVDQIKILKNLMLSLIIYLKGLLNTIANELLGEGLSYNHDDCAEYEFFEHITFEGRRYWRYR